MTGCQPQASAEWGLADQSKAAAGAHIAFVLVFCIARIAHTIAYANAIAPMRSMSWAFGTLFVFAMALQCLICYGRLLHKALDL